MDLILFNYFESVMELFNVNIMCLNKSNTTKSYNNDKGICIVCTSLFGSRIEDYEIIDYLINKENIKNKQLNEIITMVTTLNSKQPNFIVGNIVCSSDNYSANTYNINSTTISTITDDTIKKNYTLYDYFIMFLNFSVYAIFLFYAYDE